MDDVPEEITAVDLLALGDELLDDEELEEALDCYEKSWDALPEPKDEQDLAIPILAALSDAHFFLGNWEECHSKMQHALRCGADVDNPYIRLRLGQSLYELGNEREAANWLVPAYLMEGRALFDGDDPKYLDFFHGQLDPPEGGWPEGW